MKQHIALCAVALVLSLSGPALAQSYPPAYPGAVYPGPMAHGLGVPPYEVVAIVRSTGLEPLTRPVRNGPAYALRALDPAGLEVRVVVDARSGRIARVVPVPGQRYGELPPPYGRPGARAVPDGYGPGARVAVLPPAVEGAPPSAHAPALGAPPRSVQSGPPPLPRPRPKEASADSSVAPPAAMPALHAAPPVVMEAPAAPPAPIEAKPIEARPPSEAAAPPAADEMAE